MNSTSIENLNKAREALVELSAAWSKLAKAWDDPEVAKVLNDKVPVKNVDTGKVSNLYPFSKSFDEMYDDVNEWTWYMADEIDFVTARSKVISVIEGLDVRPSIIGRIATEVNDLYGYWEG